MSKESEIKKRLDKIEKERAATSQPAPQTPHRVKYQTVLPVRRRRRFSNKFIILFAIWVIALVVALLFVSGKL